MIEIYSPFMYNVSYVVILTETPNSGITGGYVLPKGATHYVHCKRNP